MQINFFFCHILILYSADVSSRESLNPSIFLMIAIF